MGMIIGTTIALLVLVLVAWVGYKKFRKPIPWIIVLPIVSIVHTCMGWYILGLAFQYDSQPDQFPLFASILAPTYSAVNMIGIPLEVIGLSDDIAYSFAFGLNAILLTTLVILIAQWIMKRIHKKSA
jgi:hypothetical protein